MKEVRKEHFATVIHNKIVYVSHGRKCVKLWVNSMGMLKVEEPEDYQANHEEADTLVIFHATKTSGNVLVRSSDTDVLVLLVSLAEKKSDSYFMMDYGSGNTCRFIDASGIAKILESNHPGLCEALIRFHALTGCDFTSAFYRKGNALPFSKLANQAYYARFEFLALRGMPALPSPYTHTPFAHPYTHKINKVS